MAKYKLRNNLLEGSDTYQDIYDKDLGISIPKDPNNADYAEYLECVAAGNTPEAAD